MHYCKIINFRGRKLEVIYFYKDIPATYWQPDESEFEIMKVEKDGVDYTPVLDRYCKMFGDIYLAIKEEIWY